MTDKLPLTARSLPIALIRARESVMQPIRAMLAHSGITEQQWRVLRILAEKGAMDSSSLAEEAALLFPSLTRIANSMRKKGLLTQTRDQKDRRRQLIDITEAGQKIIDNHHEQASRIAAGFKARLGAENYEQILDLLEELGRQETD